MAARRRVLGALLAGVIAQGISPSLASAQDDCSPPQPDDAPLLKRVSEIFTTAPHAQFRSDHGLGTLDESVTKTVMTDARACIAIYHGIYANADRQWKLPSGVSRQTALASHTIHYFRVGEYLVAVLTPNARGNEAADVVIFEKCDWCVIDSGLRYLTSITFLY